MVAVCQAGRAKCYFVVPIETLLVDREMAPAQASIPKYRLGNGNGLIQDTGDMPDPFVFVLKVKSIDGSVPKITKLLRSKLIEAAEFSRKTGEGFVLAKTSSPPIDFWKGAARIFVFR